MGMSSGGGPGKQPRPVVNITPLVDVALVVLIIFMVVAPMLMKTFSLAIPPEAKDDTERDVSDEPVILTIDQHGAMKLNRAPIQESEIAVAVPQRLAAAKHKVLHFDADDRLPYGTVLAIVDKCRDAGASSIAIVTKKLPDP